jgi:transposase-like protein
MSQSEKQHEKKVFSRELKFETVKRMDAGESSSALSKELSVKRTVLYRWRDIVRREGEKAFPGKPGRRTKAEMLAREHGGEGATELVQARRKIAELERKIGQQQLDLDFFKQALRLIEAAPKQNIARGATASSPTSRR